jgi:hypothetical protein
MEKVNGIRHVTLTVAQASQAQRASKLCTKNALLPLTKDSQEITLLTYYTLTIFLTYSTRDVPPSEK